MAILVACALVVLFASYNTEGKAIVGINWGRESAQRLLPSQVVDLLLQNDIVNARVYTSQKDILEAFAESGINLSVSIYTHLEIGSIEIARGWVKKRSQFFLPCRIGAVYLGGPIFDKMNNNTYIALSLQSLHLVQAALKESFSGRDVKANFMHSLQVLKPNRTKPSQAEFRDEIKEQMTEFLKFLKENNAPFVIHITPVLDALNIKHADITFAFPDGKTNTPIEDTNGFVYTDIIQWTIDSCLWAISNLMNNTDFKIVIGEIGWPTDGFLGANNTNAERFWKVLLPWVTSEKGTPLRPGMSIDMYIQGLADETQMIIPYYRHLGIYRSNGLPKYKIDLTDQDRDMYPVTVKGIMKMPHRWCIYNGDDRNFSKVNRLFDWACTHTDCSSVMSRGGSCSTLDFVKNVSYAFNMYFQFQFQTESACIFEGLSALTNDDPSTEECVFPIEVVKGQQMSFVAPATINYDKYGVDYFFGYNH